MQIFYIKESLYITPLQRILPFQIRVIFDKIINPD
jgi:hypothetical protein